MSYTLNHKYLGLYQGQTPVFATHAVRIESEEDFRGEIDHAPIKSPRPGHPEDLSPAGWRLYLVPTGAAKNALETVAASRGLQFESEPISIQPDVRQLISDIRPDLSQDIDAVVNRAGARRDLAQGAITAEEYLLRTD